MKNQFIYTVIPSQYLKRKIYLTLIFLVVGLFQTYSQNQIRIAGAGTNTGGGTTWNNPGNITVDDTNYATANLGGGADSRNLVSNNYAFSIPAGVTITGISVEIMRRSSSNSGGNSVIDLNLRLLKNGVAVGNSQASGTDWPTTFTAANYGGNNNLWGTTWTVADINNNNFGVLLEVDNESSNPRTAYVDYVQITVFYTNPIPTITNFSPDSACINSGATVTINGTNFTGATSVTFNGIPASYTIISNTEISATLPNGLNTGTISVTTPYGTATSSSNFTVNQLPTINPITGDFSFCQYTNTTLSNTTLGGIWSSDTPSVATIDSFGLVNGITSGNSVITYTYTDGNGCTNSVNETITVISPPLLTHSSTVCVGNIIQLLPSSGGNWISNTPSTASIDASGLATGLTIGNSNFTYTDTNTGCFETTSNIEVIDTPQILNQPAISQTFCSGNLASITTLGSGAGLSYQWFKGSFPLSNGGSISGVNTDTLTINPISLSDAGNDYYCVISGDCSPSVTTNLATIIVNEQIIIQTQPAISQSVCLNNSATFSVVASGTSLTYQWYKGGLALTDNITISGSNSDTLLINPVAATDAGNDYYCIISGASPCSSVTSNNSELIINENPNFTLQPILTQTVCSGSSASISVGATGGSISYQWYNNGNPLTDIGNISGSQTSILTINPVSNSNASSNYYCEIYNSCGSLISSNSTIIVNEIPEIEDYSVSICSEDNFSITPINGLPTLSTIIPANTTYQWPNPVVTGGIIGGTSQSGQSSITDFLINPTSSLQTATYTVIPTSGTSGTCIGNSFTVEVTVNPKPNIVNAIYNVCSNEDFSIIPTDGGGNIVPIGTTFTWGFPTVSGGIFGATTGTNENSLNQNLTNPTNTVQTATYNLTATSGSCVGSTFSITIYVNPKPTVDATPNTQEICSSETFTTLTFSNPNNLTGLIDYNWTRDNTTVITGIPNIGSGNSLSGILSNSSNIQETTTISVIAISDEGCESDNYNVQIVVNPIPAISAFPASQNICSESAITSINISNPNLVLGTTFSWTRNNTSNIIGIPTTGNGSLIAGNLTNVTSSIQTTTFVISADSNGCITTTTVDVTVYPKPTIFATPTVQSLCGGNSITPIILSNPNVVAGTTYSWTRDNTVNTTGIGSSGTSSTISGILDNFTSDNQLVNFSINASANGCSSETLIATITVFPKPLLSVSTTAQSICHNTAMTSVSVNDINSIPGTLYNWTRTNSTNITGIASSGSGTSFSGILSNNTTITQTTTFTFTATTPEGCSNTTSFTVTVYAPLTAPVIGTSQTACLLSTPGQFTMTTLPSGGSGTYTYQWQRSPDNITYTNIAGANNITYQPGFLNFGAEDTYYRLVVTNSCGTVISNVVFIEVVSNAGFTFDINNVPSSPLCPTASFTPQLTSIHLSTSAVRFRWTADANFINPASGGPVGTTGAAFWFVRTSTGNIGPLTVQNNTNASVTTQVIITPDVYNFPGPSSGSFICSTSPQTVNVTIRPTPIAFATTTNNTICSTSASGIQVSGNIIDANMSFAWTRNNTTNVTGLNSGNSGNISPGSTFTIPSILTNTTSTTQNVTFTITPSSNGCTGSSITITIAVAPNVTSGTIASNQTICYGGDPTPFTQTIASTGLNLTYQWQSSSDGTNFSNILVNGTSNTYDAPGPITQTTWYRRITISTVNGVQCQAISNNIQVIVNSINPGSISGNQTICNGGDPNPFTSINATGSGTITYQWQSNTTDCFGTWTNISGATLATYDIPSGLTTTTYYRRIATSTLNSVSCSDFSNCIVVTINNINPQIIGSDQVICGSNPNAFTIITPANGSGTLSYQWQRNTTGCSGPWSNISGATGTAYDATGVTIATYYQIVSISTLNSVQCSAPSNCISVTPNSVTPGTISGNRTVCHGGDPNPFTVSIAATGSNLTYQWQMSLTGGAGPWTDIPGATNSTYDEPGPITQTTYFRRVVFSTISGTDCSAASNFVTVFVNDVTPPVIDGSQNVCGTTDNPTAFSIITPATGIGTLTYQWQRSTVGCSGPWTNISGATSAIYDSPAVSQTTFFQLRVISSLNGVQCTTYSNCLEITSFAKTWNGSVGTDWSNPSNWTPNGVPTASHCVIIPNVSNDPIIQGTNYEAYANNLSIMSNGKLEINSTNSITVTDFVNVASNALFDIKNNASLVQINNSAINTGNIRYNRTSRPMTRWAYVYWGSPVEENVISQIPSQFDYRYRWQSGTINGSWQPLTSTTPGEGFITRVKNMLPFSTGTGTVTFPFIGKPNNGIVNVNVDSYDNSSLNTGNSVLLANPYPSAIDGEEFLTHANNDELGGTLYFWTAVTLYSGAGAYNVQDYASWNLTGGTGTAPASDPANTGLIPNGKIASGQGFFVEAFSDGQISFDNSMRESGNNTQFFRTQNNSNEKHRIWLNLYNQTKFRQALIGYIDGATNDFDRLYDGDSFTSNEINIYSLLENRALVINGKALPFSDTDIIPIGYKVSTAGNYTISIDNLDGVFAGEQNVYLKDNLTNNIHDIKLSNYNFTTEVGTFNNRFEIVFRANALGLDNPTSTIAQAYIKDEILFINATSNIQEIILFDISGKKLATFVNDIPTNSFKTEFNYPNGVYIAKVKMDDNSIVNVKIGN